MMKNYFTKLCWLAVCFVICLISISCFNRAGSQEKDKTEEQKYAIKEELSNYNNQEKNKKYKDELTGISGATPRIVANVEVETPQYLEHPPETLNAEIEKSVNEIVAPAESIKLESSEFVRLAWEASGRNDLKKIDELVNRCLLYYGVEARKQQASLFAFPNRGEENNYKSLNDVATSLFVRAEANMNNGKVQEAIVMFQELIDEYSWAQAWDPSRGAFWSIKEKSKASIDVMTGKAEEEEEAIAPTLRTKPKLFNPGKLNIVDYTKYGEFKDVGTENYKYVITDMTGLAEAVGEGIYPNSTAIYNNPRYKEVRAESRLSGKHWDYTNSDDLEAAYFKWVTAPEPQGIRLFYIGMIFEKAGMYYEAIKAYQALIVHFPKTVAWTYWQTPWYPAQAAIAKIKYIIRVNPELGLDYKYMKIEVDNGFDNNDANDVIRVYPGKIVEKNIIDKAKEKMQLVETIPLGKEIKRVGEGKVRLVQYENKHWQLIVEDKPYVIKGITYAPTKIGQTPDKGTLANWMEEDTNKNGFIDGPYDAWVDKNKNNIQDTDEPTVGDFQLLKEMGANTIRLYYNAPNVKPNKELLRKMYEQYGIRVIIGDFLGKYSIGSGASWSEGTDYSNPEHQKNMLESVRQMVMEYKDEPFLLFWILGNENNYGVACNADKNPEAYYKFVNQVAQFIKSLDKDHPVSIGNGDALYLDVFAKYAPDVDIFGANIYRGDYGFGAFWEQVFDASGKPAYITEYGCPAFAKHLTYDEGEEAQKLYHQGNWIDIEDNLAGRARGVGNSLGGITFEWLDEWWKNYEPFRHDRKSDAIGPFPGGYYFEEWFGLVSQGKGQHSPFLRQLRKSYEYYKDAWNKL